MFRLHVIFDSNAYRQLSDARFQQLQALERAKAVGALASFWTIAELLSHLASTEDPSYRSAIAATRRLAVHCSTPGSERPQLNLLADSEDHLCYTLFGKTIPNREEQTKIYAILVHRVATSVSPTDLDELRPSFTELAEKLAGTERQFVTDMWNHVVRGLDPEARSWRPSDDDPDRRQRLLASINSTDGLRQAASMLVIKASNEVGIILDQRLLEEKMAFLLSVYEPPLRLYNSILKRIILDGCDVSKAGRPNWIWDIQMAFSTSPRARLAGVPVWLITDDKAILGAAREGGACHLVHRLSRYLTLLEGPDDQLAKVVAAA